MKAMSIIELKTLVTRLEVLLKDSQLQDIISNDRGLVLGFRGREHQWLVADMNPSNPFCLVFTAYCPLKKGPKPKPVALFLNSHAKNLYFRKAWLDEEFGRVLKVELSNAQKSCLVEFILIPRQANLLVESEGKKIAWDKPRDLSPHPESGPLPDPRNLEEIHEGWLAELQGGVRPSIDPKAQWEKKRDKDLEKKRKALLEIDHTLQEHPVEKFYALGNFLKTLSSEGFLPRNVPAEWHGLLDFKQKIFANIEVVFEKAKQAASKLQGTQERRRILLSEIRKLELATFEGSQSLQGSDRSKIDDLMKNISAKGRKLHLESGAVVYCGKSGADNLALLRKAKAWDYWLHLKDYPGAHAILHRSRDQEISYEEVQKAALWVLKESLGSKTLMPGEKYSVVLVECRFVRPIKGDKLGRVTYHSEKQLTVSNS